MEPTRDLLAAAAALLDRLADEGLKLATAESCTGGLAAATLTDVPGSSKVFDRGYVTYSNEAKRSLLGVSDDLLREHGAVSEAVARAMAEGVLRELDAHAALAITGIAGPDGGTPEKPVGLVHFAAARSGGPTIHREKRFGDIGRIEVRRLSVAEAFKLVGELLDLSAPRFGV